MKIATRWAKMNGALRLGAGIAAISAATAPIAVWAQDTAPIPPSATPRSSELQQGVVAGALRDVDGARVDTTAVERAPCPLAAPEFADISFTLRNVVFNGLDTLPEPIDLSSTYAGMEGRELSVAAVCEIRDRAAMRLRDAGYLAAVQVPPQRIEGGTLTLDVLAARITRLQIKGDAGPNEGLLLRYLSPLTEQAVFNRFDAERALLLTRDIPGMDARLALRPVDGRPGELIGEVSVRTIPFTTDVSAQNFGSEAVGRWSLLGRARLTNLTGMGDSTTLSMIYSGDFYEQQVYQLSHEFRVGRNGVRLAADLTYAESRPTVGGANPFESTTFAATLRGDYPVIRSQTRNLFVGGGFDLVDQDVEFSSFPLSEDRLRIGWIRADYAQIDARSAAGIGGYTAVEPKYYFTAGLQLRHGLDIFGASTDCGKKIDACLAPGEVITSRLEGDPTALVVRGQADITYRPIPKLAFNFAPRFQYSPDPLLSYEEFAFGNYTIGRGYDPGAIIGDSVFGFRSEIRSGSLWPDRVGGTAVQPYAFFDGAWAWNKDSAFDGLNPRKIFSTGAGARMSFLDRIRLDALVAVPLRDTLFDEAKGDVRLLLNLSIQFHR